MKPHFLYSHSGGGGGVQTRVIVMMMENLVEWRLAGETEVFGENLPQRQFVHHKCHLPDTGSNPDRRGGKPATDRLSYGAAMKPRKNR
jgi:phage-related protein